MNKLKSPSICLNMIVKNESRIIERCLKSVYDLVDTWCIIDTGSTDGTQDIIRKYMKDKPGVLLEQPWVNFGHNRNEGLAFARTWGEWTLLIDADMVLINKGFDKNVLDANIDVVDIAQDNNGTVYNNMRLLNNRKEWRCIGVTHEYYDCVGGVNERRFTDKLMFDDISDGGSKGDKFERDIRLLTQGIIDEPENVRYYFYLAQSYRDIGDFENAIKHYQKRHDMGGWDEESWFALYMVGWCMDRRGDSFEDISAVLLKSWILRPWRIEPIWILTMRARTEGRWPQAYQLSKIMATTDYPTHDVLFIAKAAYGFAALDEYTVAAYHAGHLAESEKAAEKILNNPETPRSEIGRIKRNLWWARKGQGLYNENALNEFIEQFKKQI